MKIAIAAAILVLPVAGVAQAPSVQESRAAAPDSHIVIPFLADATRPAALEFEGGECDLEAGGSRMTCTFQQVFLTTSSVAPDTCLVTTNRYQRTFRQEAAGKWVSNLGPEGSCGVVDVATLSDGGGVRWTMEINKAATNRNAAECKAIAEQPVRLSWQNIRRPLPCRFVQPAGLSR